MGERAGSGESRCRERAMKGCPSYQRSRFQDARRLVAYSGCRLAMVPTYAIVNELCFKIGDRSQVLNGAAAQAGPDCRQ